MEDKKRKNRKKPEATVNHDPFLWKAIREANNTEITWKQEDIDYLVDLFK